MMAIFLQFLPYLFTAAQDIPQIYEYIQKVRADLQQKDEWTPEAEDAFNKELQTLKDSPPAWWKPDAT
jgi:hypothetical protein